MGRFASEAREKCFMLCFEGVVFFSKETCFPHVPVSVFSRRFFLRFEKQSSFHNLAFAGVGANLMLCAVNAVQGLGQTQASWQREATSGGLKGFPREGKAPLP